MKGVLLGASLAALTLTAEGRAVTAKGMSVAAVVGKNLLKRQGVDLSAYLDDQMPRSNTGTVVAGGGGDGVEPADQ